MVKRILLMGVGSLTALCAFLTPLTWLRAALFENKDTIPVAATIQQTASQGATEAAEKTEPLRFPFVVEGTTLIAQSLALYEGDMVEDGSGEPLVDAAALELYNFGSDEIELAEVTLEFSQTNMTFFGTNIPAGGRVLVIEQDAKLWTPEWCTKCYGSVQYSTNRALPESSLRIEDVDMGTVAVTNMTEQSMENVWLFYKTYHADADLYIGGITYIEEIPHIEPGQTVMVTPDRYASGYTKILKAELIK